MGTEENYYDFLKNILTILLILVDFFGTLAIRRRLNYYLDVPISVNCRIPLHAKLPN